MENRIERLESLVALQDRSMEKLSDRLFEQQQQITDLEKLVRRLAGKVREIDADMEHSGGLDVPPPHYNG
ncbi:SlyX protein [Pseudodesulfovibrio sp. JC047]|uniref:SlyX family protein n=1 Tax=Pseudodesulfovibrio sp. JC047 TaxID=2683199 RepID=UPI0013D4E963|nr:SlyX family protein [Pseudodesulfovibrio sp. JC047]NDV18238.1 SlyX protein [Pseudodesulfovibrio sp. JC047]